MSASIAFLPPDHGAPLRVRSLVAAGVVALHVLLVAMLWLGQETVAPPQVPVVRVSFLVAPVSAPESPEPAVVPPPLVRQAPAPLLSSARPKVAEAAPAAPVQEEAVAEPAPSPAPAPLAAPAPDAAPAAAVAATIPSFDAAYLRNPRPVYPLVSRRLGEQGTTYLRVHVGVDGRPLQVQVGRSSGFDRLDRAAADAVRGWQFVPAREGATPVTGWVTVPISWKLEK